MSIPLNRVLVETDGPNNKLFKNNFSTDNIVSAYKIIADKFGVSNLEEQCYKNFTNLLVK